MTAAEKRRIAADPEALERVRREGAEMLLGRFLGRRQTGKEIDAELHSILAQRALREPVTEPARFGLPSMRTTAIRAGTVPGLIQP